jgi:methionine-rich copper-binding protein CopC
MAGNKMKNVIARSVTMIALAASALGATALLPHTRLVKSEPGKDSTVTTAPKELKLFFSEAVKASVAGVRLLASDSSVVPLGTLKNGDGQPAPVVAPVTGAIKPGAYRVMWRVTGADGHPITGNYVFTVKPPKSAN